MNATYNPFRAAAEAAFSEITSEQAKQFYALKAQKDFQNALDGAITVCAWAYQLAQMAYMMGAQCREWCEDLHVRTGECDRATPLLTPAKITPIAPPTDTGKKLLGEAIKSGLRLIGEDESTTPRELLLLPAAPPVNKPKRQPRKKKTL